MSTVNDLQISLSSRKNFLDLLACTRTFLSFSPFKRQSPGTSPTWNCLDMCVTVANCEFATLLVSKPFCTLKRSWRFEERCTAVLFGTTLVVAAYAPDSTKGMEMHKAFISSVLRVRREGRRGGARDFYITGDINVVLGMMCTDENDIEDLNEMYGPLCWQGYDRDPGGFKNLMWYGNMKEFHCKATDWRTTSTRSSPLGVRAGHGQTMLRLFRFKRQRRNMSRLLCKDLQNGQEDMYTDGITFSV